MSATQLILVIVVVLLLFGGFGGLHPVVTTNYGYWPSGALGFVLLVVLILVLAGR